jgi:hypothetical protein
MPREHFHRFFFVFFSLFFSQESTYRVSFYRVSFDKSQRTKIFHTFQLHNFTHIFIKNVEQIKHHRVTNILVPHSALQAHCTYQLLPSKSLSEVEFIPKFNRMMLVTFLFILGFFSLPDHNCIIYTANTKIN